MLWSHVWEDAKDFTVSFRGFVVVGGGWVLWGLMIGEALGDSSPWLRFAVIVAGVVVPLAIVGIYKMIRPTARWEAGVENLRDSLMFKLTSLRAQRVAYVELILTRPSGHRLLASDIAQDVPAGAECWHQYPHGFKEGAAKWLVPGTYRYEWSVRPTGETEKLQRVAEGSHVVEPPPAEPYDAE